MSGSPHDPCGFHQPYGYIGADDIGFSAVITAPAGVAAYAEFLIVPNDGSPPLDFTVAAVSGSPARIVVPQSDFTSGVTYTWQVRATDANGDVSPLTRACHFISDQTQPSQPTVSSATFNSTTEPVAGTLGTFTFTASGPDVGAVVGFDYALNSQLGAGSESEFPAFGNGFVAIGPGGTATTPELRSIYPGPNFITVDAVDHAGNVSQPVTYSFDLATPPPAADKDMNGDGVPDLLTIGDTAGLAPGLWLATGKPKSRTGQVDPHATNIGINGAGLDAGDDGPYEFDGAQVITGQFFAEGFQDVLVYFPAGNDAGGGVILHGTGDGSALPAVDQNVNIAAGDLADANGDSPLQVVNAYGSIYGTGLPDLLAINGDPVNGYYLDYYDESVPGGFINTFSIQTPTPDGTMDWNQWTLATLSYSGGIGMFLWNESTGALYLWTGATFTDNGNGTGSIAYTQYLISSDWNTGQPLSTLEAAEFPGNSVPDLWTVTPAGVVTAYVISDLSATGTATITAGKPQQLS